MKQIIKTAIEDYERSIQIIKDYDLLTAWAKCRVIGTTDGLCMYFKVKQGPARGIEIITLLSNKEKIADYWWKRPIWVTLDQTISAMEQRLEFLKQAYDSNSTNNLYYIIKLWLNYRF